MQLMLIRHARPHHVTDPTRVADPDLTPEGERQAQGLADFLTTAPYGVVTSLSASTMQRAIQTATPLEKALGLPFDTDPRIVEVDSGWTSYGVGLDTYPSRRAAWDDMNRGRLGDNVFDPNEFSARVVAGLEDIVARESGNDSIAAVVCHGGVISAYLAHILTVPRMFFVDTTYTSITRINADADGYREVVSVNEATHVRP